MQVNAISCAFRGVGCGRAGQGGEGIRAVGGGAATSAGRGAAWVVSRGDARVVVSGAWASRTRPGQCESAALRPACQPPRPVPSFGQDLRWRRRQGSVSGGGSTTTKSAGAGAEGGAKDGGGEGAESKPEAADGVGSYVLEPTEEDLLDMDGPLHKIVHGFATFLLGLAKVFSAMAYANKEWLEKRRRNRWWSRPTGKTIPKGIKKETVGKDLKPGSGVLKKMIPLGLLFFCTSFNLTILANTKDALIITAPGAGVEAVPFLATYGVLPASIGMMLLYGKVVSTFPSRFVYYLTALPLLAFYAFFAVVLFPNADALHPHIWAEAVANSVPAGLHGLIGIVRNWTYSLFFVAGELWGGVMISLLFWSLANEVCTVSEAKGIYPVLGIAANFALVASGNYLKFINTLLADAPMGVTVNALVATVIVVSVVMGGAKWYLDRTLRGDEADAPLPMKKGKKAKASKGEVMNILKKIRNLALLVVGYGVSHKLFEVAWKGQLRMLCPSPQAYGAVLGDISTATGAVTIVLMLAGRYVFQYLGWGAAATATPLVMLVTGGVFFGLSLLAKAGLTIGTLPAVKVAWVAAMAGAVTQVFARSSKYSLFDPAKEMVYIEMGKEEKTKGKAAVDLVGSQVGKSGASWLNQILLLTMGSMTAALPVISGVFVVSIVAWLNAVRHLNNNLLEDEDSKAADELEAAQLGDAGAPAAQGTA